MWKVKRIIVRVLIFFLLFNAFFIFLILPTVYPHGYIHYLFGVPVVKPRKISSEKYYLSISAMVKNRADYMAEKVEFYLMIGVQHIYLYDNNSTDNLKEVMKPYLKNNLVTLIPFPRQHVTLIDGSEEILTQKLSLKNSIETHACETRWMATIDSYEFIVPARKTDSLVDILRNFEGFTSVVIP